MRKYLFFALLFTIFSATIFGQGTIKGTVSDKDSGEPLMFCSVYVPDSDPIIGGETDMDGNYEISIEAGQHSIEISYVGYANKTITEIDVKDGEVTVMDILMGGGDDAVQLDDVVVTAKALKHTENALLALQRKSTSIQDGISSQEISRFGASNAASAMKRVTGASVVDGKYIFVRGLGDRYSSAMLNGIPLPSTDPYRNSVSLDLVPANLLDNMVASKTFAPNQPGNFTGGNVDMKTKSFPEKFTLSANISTSFNENSSLNNNFLTYNGGGNDWLGYDDGTRALPEYLQNQEVRDQLVGSLNTQAKSNNEKAAVLDGAINSLSNEMAPTTMQSPMNYGASFAVGNQFDMGNDSKLGVLVGLNYKRNFTHYENGVFANWELTDRTGDQLTNNQNLMDTRSVENPSLGGMASINYKFAGSQKIGFNVLYNHDAQKEARSLNGTFPAILSGGGFESRSILFKERELASYQLTGEHLLTESGIKLEWGGGFVASSQEEPDLRLFANSFLENSADGGLDYFISASEFDLPYRFFRNLEDQQVSVKVDLTIPFFQNKSKANKIQVGGFYQKKDRNFNEDRFQYQVKSRDAADYAGDPTAFFGSENLGIIGQNDRGQNVTGLFLTDETVLANSYTGTEEVTTAYAMGTYDFGKLKVVAGARMEITDMDVQSADESKDAGTIDQVDVLPSANLIYALGEKTNLRASYTHTLARPNMREMAPFSSFEFIGDFIFTGNPDLERTLVKNYDLRWEFFPKSGEVIALSAYYKDFTNPISIAFVPEAANPEIRYENLEEAMVYGVEAEFRKNLGFLSPKLNDFKVFSNISFIHSVSPVPTQEKEIIEEINPDKGTTRPFIGQSPFLFNAGLNYSNRDLGWDATVAVNAFGDRLQSLRFGEQPDIYEQSRADLDFTVRKSINDRMNLKVSIMNLLDARYRTQMNFKGNEFIVTDFRRGRTYGVSLSYDI